MLDYLKALHPIGSCSLEQAHTQHDSSTSETWCAAVHYYGLCSLGHADTAMGAIHAVVAKRDKALAETVAPRA